MQANISIFSQGSLAYQTRCAGRLILDSDVAVTVCHYILLDTVPKKSLLIFCTVLKVVHRGGWFPVARVM